VYRQSSRPVHSRLAAKEGEGRGRTSFRRFAFHVAMASFPPTVKLIELSATEFLPLFAGWFDDPLPSRRRW
jgi:hypothetical protein